MLSFNSPDMSSSCLKAAFRKQASGNNLEGNSKESVCIKFGSVRELAQKECVHHDGKGHSPEGQSFWKQVNKKTKNCWQAYCVLYSGSWH